jgi:flagellar basal body P-ring formation protein FlgA
MVLIVGEQEVHQATITASARAWQTHLVLARPLATRQPIREEDLLERRTLADRLPEEPPLSRPEVVGRPSARPLPAGTILTAGALDAAELVRAGDSVTITLTQGAVNMKSIATALESGTQGQTICVQDEATGEVFQVILTGRRAATMNLSAISGNLATAGAE